MKYGLFGINFGPCANPETAAKAARAAEAAGFESAWTGEHVVLPDPQVPPSPVPPGLPMLDPAVALSFVAAHTKTIKLGTGIIILPQRNPVVLAKELASVDVLSGGRLIFGIGIGYLKPEFDAIGAPFDRKGARTEDALKAILALWTQEKPAYRGEFTSFSGIDAHPRPVQKPHPPIVFGGGSRDAFGRAIRLAQGWYGFSMNLEKARDAVAGLRDVAKKVERPAALGKLEISISPPPSFRWDEAARYAELGVDRLILLSPARDADGYLRFVDEAGDKIER